MGGFVGWEDGGLRMMWMGEECRWSRWCVYAERSLDEEAQKEMILLFK